MSFTDANTKEIDLGWKRIQKELKLIDKSYTQIGIQKDAGKEKKRVRKKGIQTDASIEESDITIAEVAYINEYGLGHVPVRSFMRSTFDEKRVKTDRFIDKHYSLILKGKSTVKKSLGLLGEYMEGEVKKKITDLRTPPNSPVTIKLKKSSNPLIDIGTMRASIRHVEVIKEK